MRRISKFYAGYIVALIIVIFYIPGICAQAHGYRLPENYQEISKWSVHEISLNSKKDYDNPYTSVIVFATFRGPTGEEKNVRGFWDGENTYRVRFTPTRTGFWHYKIYSTPKDAGLSQSGSFLVKDSNPDSHGFLRRDCQYPRSFLFDDGTRFLMVGQTYYELVRYAAVNDDWKESVDQSEKYGFSKIRILLWIWNAGNSPFPKIYPFSQRNKDRININYFKIFDKVIEYLNEKEVIADVILMPDLKDAFGSLEQDKRYFRYAIARYAAYPNVIWTLANEWEYTPYGENSKWYWDTIGEMVSKEDPWMREGCALRPLSIHQRTCYKFKWGSSQWPVHAVVQAGVWNGRNGGPRYANGDEWGNYSIVRNLDINMPIVNDECGYYGQTYSTKGIFTEIDRGNLRRALWGILLGGGYGSIGDDTGGQDWLQWLNTVFYKNLIGGKRKIARPWLTGIWHDLDVYDDVKHLNDFLEIRKIKYWLMSSRNDLVSVGKRVYVLADKDIEFIVYSANGEEFKIKIPSGNYDFYWFNPVTGENRYGGMVYGADEERFSVPFENDAVLHIKKSR